MGLGDSVYQYHEQSLGLPLHDAELLHEHAKLVLGDAQGKDIGRGHLLNIGANQLEYFVNDLIGLEIGHSLAEKVCQLILSELVGSAFLEYDVEKIHDIFSQVSIHNLSKDADKIVKGRVELEPGELLAQDLFVDGDIHEVQHGLKALLVLFSVSTAEFNQREIVAL